MLVALAVSVPLLTKLPLISSVKLAPAMVTVAPVLMVKSLQTADPVLIVGILGTPELMITSVVDVGTPLHQLAALCQFVSVAPSHPAPAVTVI